MVGRAGRSGFGSEGESFLVCQKMDLEKVKKLLHSQMDETTSKIDFDSCKELILCSIGLGTATTRKTLRELVSCSLLHSQVFSFENICIPEMARGQTSNTPSCVIKILSFTVCQIEC